ncbi:MAG: glutamate--tRNA ligase [Candidatus Woesearchaeota archaeon]|jgi:glutamyl-tRNA synthetase
MADDALDMKTIESKIRYYALENAMKFNGKANQGAVVGKILSEFPNAKKNMGEIGKKISAILSDVNGTSVDEQKNELLKLNPSYFDEQKEQKDKRKEERSELPELKNTVYGKVITRISPEPSKYNHFGHAISFLFNHMYAQKYGGKTILRYEDTNPEKGAQEYVDAMNKDVLEYLDIHVAETIFVSDRLPQYYDMAGFAINSNNAFTCFCTSEMISKDRREMRDCPCRKKSLDITKEEWQKMLDGKFAEGECTLRLKIDMQHKNAVMRDPVIFRLSYAPHYRQGTKYKVWPMYDFENSVEEGNYGITHVFRSNEFESRIELQNYIRQLFSLSNPEIKQYARFNVVGGETHGREIRKMIESGEYSGWDDIRLVTLRALKRRGIVKDSYYELAKIIGMSKSVSDLDFSQIAAVNRRLLDEKADRFFFIENPIQIEIDGAPKQEIELDLHPTNKKGGRKFSTHTKFYVNKKDLNEVKDGEIIRFMDCLNFKINGADFEIDSIEYEKFKGRGQKLIHFLPYEETLDVEVLMPDNVTIAGLGERNIKILKIGDIVQFERFGFARLDEISIDGTYKFWFSHR